MNGIHEVSGSIPLSSTISSLHENFFNKFNLLIETSFLVRTHVRTQIAYPPVEEVPPLPENSPSHLPKPYVYTLRVDNFSVVNLASQSLSSWQ